MTRYFKNFGGGAWPRRPPMATPMLLTPGLRSMKQLASTKMYIDQYHVQHKTKLIVCSSKEKRDAR